MTIGMPIRRLSSGVVGLDEVLGGGIPELSFNLIIGGPGCGKTTLGHHIAFANATPESKALYFTVIGEPPIKMLRYQQQYSFFDTKKVGDSIHFVNLASDAVAGGLGAVLARIIEEVQRIGPALVIVDSFRSVMRHLASTSTDLGVEDFIQRLALELTSCEATTFLLGEYTHSQDDNPVFTVADGIITLQQSVERNSVVRKLQVVKMRGQGQIPGLQTMRIDQDGLSVFPRLLNPTNTLPKDAYEGRLETGVAGLDAMLGGGVPRGYSVLVAGPSGSGKTILTNQFIYEGGKKGEPGIVAVFEKRPNDYMQTTPFRHDFDRMTAAGKLEILYLRPLDLSIDETLLAMRKAVERVGAKRAVIDSLSGLELALAPTFRDDFRESLYRMVGALTGLGVTVMSTVELSDSFVDLKFSPQSIAFLTDAIIMQRYVEIDGDLRRAIGVVKVRGSQHSKEVREYTIGTDGRLAVGGALKGYVGLLSGSPRKTI